MTEVQIAIEVLGAIYQAALSHWSRIETGVTRKEFLQLLEWLVSVTLERRGSSSYALSDHSAVREYCGFLAECYRDRERDPDAAALSAVRRARARSALQERIDPASLA